MASAADRVAQRRSQSLYFVFLSVLVTLEMMSLKAAQDSLPLFISAENRSVM